MGNNLKIFGSIGDPFTLHLNNTTKPLRPYDDFVISRYGKNAKPISYYGDSSWDLTPYSNRVGSVRLRFNSRIKCPSTMMKSDYDLYINDVKWLMFLLAKHTKSGVGRLNEVAPSTLLSYFNPLVYLTNYIIRNNLSFETVLCNHSALYKCISGMSEQYGQILIKLVGYLLIMGENATGYKTVSEEFLNSVKIKAKISATYTGEYQTIVIPQRIYSKLIEEAIMRLELFSKHKESIFKLIRRVNECQCYGRTRNFQNQLFLTLGVPFSEREYEPEFKSAVRAFKLEAICSQHYLNCYSALSRYLTRIQILSKFLIVALSGMRSGESYKLVYDCLEEYEDGNQIMLRGGTYKLHGALKHDYWISCDAVKLPISVLRSLVDFIAEMTGIHAKRIPFFYPTANDFWTNMSQARTWQVYYLTDSPINPTKKVLDELNTKVEPQYHWLNVPVTQADIDELNELEKVNPNPVNFNNHHKIKLGMAFPISLHQLRRSLAVYFLGSGLVSLSSLCRQFKHLNKGMTLYYAKGSQYAKDLFGSSKGSFYYEINNNREEEVINSILRAYLSDERLFGVRGIELENSIKFRQSAVTADSTAVILAVRSEVMTKVKKGLISIIETPLGNCMSTEHCDKRQMRDFTSCIRCKDAIILKSKLENEIKIQKKMIEKIQTLEPNHINLAWENERLAELEKYYSRLNKENHEYN